MLLLLEFLQRALTLLEVRPAAPQVTQRLLHLELVREKLVPVRVHLLQQKLVPELRVARDLRPDELSSLDDLAPRLQLLLAHHLPQPVVAQDVVRGRLASHSARPDGAVPVARVIRVVGLVRSQLQQRHERALHLVLVPERVVAHDEVEPGVDVRLGGHDLAQGVRRVDVLAHANERGRDVARDFHS